MNEIQIIKKQIELLTERKKEALINRKVTAFLNYHDQINQLRAKNKELNK